MNVNRETLSNFLFKHYSRSNGSTHMDIINCKKYNIWCCGNHVQGPEFDSRQNWYKTYKEFNKKHENECPQCKFLNLYAKTKYKPNLLERTNEFAGPILVDIDLKSDIKKPLYTEKQVLTLTRLFQKVLRDNVNTPLKSESFDCYVLEKPGYEKDGKFKNGFHLHFPYIWLSAVDRQKINDLVQKNTKFELDNNIIRGNWFLYGSGKQLGGSYTVSYIIEEKRNKVLCTKDFTELVWLLSVIPRHTTIVSKLNTNELIQTTNQNYIKLEDIEHQYTKVKNTTKKSYGQGPRDRRSYKELKHYINQLSSFRSEDYNSWKSVGCVIFNEIENENDGLKLWHEFSQKCIKKYNELECDVFWNKLSNRKTNYSLGTLMYYCKQDNGNVDKYNRQQSWYFKPEPEIIDMIENYVLHNFPAVSDLTIEEREILVCTMRREPWTCYMDQVKNMFINDIENYNHLMTLNIDKQKHKMKNIVEIFRKYVQDNIAKYTTARTHNKWCEKVLFSLKRSKKEHMLLSNTDDIDIDIEPENDVLTEREKYEEMFYGDNDDEYMLL